MKVSTGHHRNIVIVNLYYPKCLEGDCPQAKGSFVATALFPVGGKTQSRGNSPPGASVENILEQDRNQRKARGPSPPDKVLAPLVGLGQGMKSPKIRIFKYKYIIFL